MSLKVFSIDERRESSLRTYTKIVKTQICEYPIFVFFHIFLSAYFEIYGSVIFRQDSRNTFVGLFILRGENLKYASQTKKKNLYLTLFFLLFEMSGSWKINLQTEQESLLFQSRLLT